MKYKINEEKISVAIADFESKVDFEFVPIITSKSAYTEHVRWLLSLIFLLFFVGCIDAIFYNSWGDKTYYFIAAPFLAVILGSILDRSDLVDRFFISKAERERQVLEKAQRLFFLNQLDRAKSNNSLLLLISILEKQIVILPDPKISKLSPEQVTELTQKALKTLQQNFKSKKYENGLLETIKMLKNELEPHFPRQGSAENSIANKLIWWDD